MAATQIPEVILESSNGRRTMPVLSFGTAANNLEPEVLKEAVLEAIKLGYHHFDTAYEYGSEQSLGVAIAKALELGLVASRDELFITSKLWPNDAHPDLVIPALKKSLQNLQLEYLDLYLIHWPISATPGKLSHVLEEKDQMPMDFKGVWADMEEAQRLGLTKSIGISNFSTKKTQNLLSFATIPPSVNQVEMSPFWQQKKLRDFCKANGIVVTAFSPLGAIGTSWGTNHVLESKVLNEIAEAHGKTVPQVCIRWVYQVGATLAVKSYNKERLKQNVQVFDWELSEEDLDKINQIPQHRMMLREEYVTANGPYKSLEELWDGEL
ncbi:PREDICTED: non-functional NADPH-dependent codeinone reductase 2-like [Fragaria vesca subsp. vesca]|uniref:non-functional NADPH-dependent codeinone reductase 2-like n=1 Tax=Fragaria vesca subsp. vesca TaxID=101020 RepID=UPI0002C37493|nr:PREDICTED: non-functional NADPH-dependent codeinone reductase 2-like [Fragaria vesca subsp. vesca]